MEKETGVFQAPVFCYTLYLFSVWISFRAVLGLLFGLVFFRNTDVCFFGITLTYSLLWVEVQRWLGKFT
ncbi:MAG: hypothetical protein CVU11_16580 [Bacteroidetes bacterium HGW-Bacteroidetes-6]|jgi:hypothetical protein|nr:MAG: hypothetical protein CVU11_16580 [Bacteroidetes bacterium HGW-Bacteroidetes-6]